ncbi:MAG: LTA synthase family protein [Desulfobacteraceae bacterium]|jgi:phosphoglycerol transferase MdoB-like AlkP superfamily enzyme
MHKKKNIRHLIFPYYPIVIFFVSTLIFLSVFRLGLVLFHHGRIPGFSGLIKILVYGIRIDIVSSVYAIALPVLLTPFLEGYRISHGLWQKFLSTWLTIWAVIFVVMEFITPGYIKEYDVRPNRLFVEYLTYPRELVYMLLKGYLIHVLIGTAALILSVYLVYRFMTRLSHPASNWNFFHKLAYFPVLAILLFLGARSSLGHRPINPSNVAFSSDSLVNDLALNSTYSLLYSVYRMKDEADAAKEYGSMDKDRMLGIVKKNSSTETEDFSNPDIPTLHRLKATSHRKKPLNLVIILEESLGAEFVSNLGGTPVTPNLERLAKEGLWFNQLYATGTRSVMGIEAVVCGYPPTPARSVVKLGKSQKNFFTLADLLSKKGYETRFIYGGDSNFDNMKGFFLHNGFQKVIDEKDFDHPGFKGSWGVSDQDLFDKAHDYFMSRKGKPFFSLVFSSSNHPPYEFPDNTIELHEQPKETVKNAVKYADYALNKFFEKARKSPYWANTVFLVVADHNSHVGGESLVPVPRFRIPALIIGPGVKPSVYNEIASQIDLPPTLLSIMGISCDTPMIGRDLTDKPASLPGRAILQFYKNQAYMTDDQVVILQPGEKINAYRYTDLKLIPDVLNKNQAETALAHALWSSWTYKNSMYKVP